MTTRKTGRTDNKLQGYVTEKLEEAKGRFVALERGAGDVLQNLLERGRFQGKDLGHLIEKLTPTEFPLFDAPAVKELGKRATKASTEVRKRLDGLQARVVAASGVASQAQVKEINRELGRLTKKIDALITRKNSARA